MKMFSGSFYEILMIASNAVQIGLLLWLYVRKFLDDIYKQIEKHEFRL